MVSASSCSAGKAGAYYKKDDYYSRESSGEFHGKAVKAHGVERDGVFQDEFQGLVDRLEKYRNIKISLTLPVGELGYLYDSKHRRERLQKTLYMGLEKSLSKNRLGIKLDSRTSKITFDGKNYRFTVTSHGIFKKNRYSSKNFDKKFEAINDNLKAVEKDMKRAINLSPMKLNHEYIKKASMSVGQERGIVGDDFTFSPPKSVSIARILRDDLEKIITAAHDRAVKNALDYAEANLIQYRTKSNGKDNFVRSGKMLAVRFDHETSRSLDPQFHSHCIIMRSTIDMDGKPRKTFNRPLYKGKRDLDRIYMGTLGNELERAGIEIEVVDKRGNFELKMIPKELIISNSSRRADILAYLKRFGISGDKITREMGNRAAIRTRLRKQDIDLERWKKEKRFEIKKDMVRLGVRLPEPGPAPGMEGAGQGKLDEEEKEKDVLASLYAGLPPDRTMSRFDLQRIRTVIKDLNETESVVTAEMIVKSGLMRKKKKGKIHLDLGKVEYYLKHSTDWMEMDALSENVLPEDMKGKTLYSTIDDLKMERDVWDLLTDRREIFEPVDLSAVDRHLEKTRLNESQKNAIRFISSEKEQVTLVQGVAGAGKTSSLRELKLIFEENGYTIFGISPTNKAAERMKKDGFPSAKTIHGYLNQLERDSGVEVKEEVYSKKSGYRREWDLSRVKPMNPGREVVVVDEGTMVNHHEMKQLIQAARRRSAKIVFIGDVSQLKPVGKGKWFNRMYHDDLVPRTIMSGILRQRNAPKHLRESVRVASEHNIAESVFHLKSNIKQIESKKERIGEIASRFAQISKRDGMDSVMIATGINTVREHINLAVQEELVLSGQLASKPGEYIQVDSVNHDEEPEKKTFYVGDRVILRDAQFDGDSKEKIQKNSVGYVQSVSEVDGIEVVFEDKTLSFRDDDIIKLDHAYCITFHKSQGGSYQNVILNYGAGEPTTHMESYYVGISRLERHVEVFTDNTWQFLKQVQEAQKKLDPKDILGPDDVQIDREGAAVGSGNTPPAMSWRDRVEVLIKEGEPVREEVRAAAQKLAMDIQRKSYKSPGEWTPRQWELDNITSVLDDMNQRENVISPDRVVKGGLQMKEKIILDPKHVESYLQRAPDWVELGKGIDGKTFFASKKDLEIEGAVWSRISKNGEIFKPVRSKKVDRHLEKTILNSSQRRAVRFMAMGKMKVNLLHCENGAGKSSLLEEFKEIMERDGYTVTALGADNTAAGRLAREGFAEARTVHGYLHGLERESGAVTGGPQFNREKGFKTKWDLSLVAPVNPRREIILVDDAPMLGSNEMKYLLDAAGRREAKIVFIGDDGGLKAVGKGKWFNRMYNDGLVPGESVTGMIRQWNVARDLQKSIDELKKGKIVSSMYHLRSHTVEIFGKEKRFAAIADKFLDFASREGLDSVMVVTGGNQDREMINGIVRSKLLEKGHLSTPAGHGIKVPAINGKGETVEREFTAGDRVILNESHYCRDTRVKIVKNSIGYIDAVSPEQGIDVTFGDKSVRLSGEEMAALDHAYALTYFKGRGGYRNVIVNIGARERMTSRESFYEGITSYSGDIRIYTDDRHGILEGVSRVYEKKDPFDILAPRDITLNHMGELRPAAYDKIPAVHQDRVDNYIKRADELTRQTFLLESRVNRMEERLMRLTNNDERLPPRWLKRVKKQIKRDAREVKKEVNALRGRQITLEKARRKLIDGLKKPGLLEKLNIAPEQLVKESRDLVSQAILVRENAFNKMEVIKMEIGKGKGMGMGLGA